MIKFIYIIYILTYILNPLSSFAKEKIILAADYWCPYNCNPKDKNPGYLVEIAKLAFEKNNINIEYQLMSWHEALLKLESGQINGVIGAHDDEVEGAILPNTNLIKAKYASFTLLDNPWQYNENYSLDKKIIGLTVDYSYPSEIRNYIHSNMLIKPDKFIFHESNNSVSDNVNDIIINKTSVYIEEKSVANYYLENNNIKVIKNSGNIPGDNKILYIAFSKENSNSRRYSEILTSEFNKLKNNGTVKLLLDKYKLTEASESE